MSYNIFIKSYTYLNIFYFIFLIRILLEYRIYIENKLLII